MCVYICIFVSVSLHHILPLFPPQKKKQTKTTPKNPLSFNGIWASASLFVDKNPFVEHPIDDDRGRLSPHTFSEKRWVNPPREGVFTYPIAFGDGNSSSQRKTFVFLICFFSRGARVRYPLVPSPLSPQEAGGSQAWRETPSIPTDNQTTQWVRNEPKKHIA